MFGGRKCVREGEPGPGGGGKGKGWLKGGTRVKCLLKLPYANPEQKRQEKDSQTHRVALGWRGALHRTIGFRCADRAIP